MPRPYAYLLPLTIVGCILSLTAVPLSAHTADSPPNIVLILLDDLGYGDVGCYGQQKIATPRINRLAEQGMRFTQHYAGSTVCAPSRCALVTGLHTGHCTVRGNVDVLLGEEPTIASVLKKAGYHTACIGKWGIGHPPPPGDPERAGFDDFNGYLSMWHAHNAFPEFLWQGDQRHQLRNQVRHPATHYKEGQEKLTGVSQNKVDFAGDQFTEKSLEWLAASDEPFFLFVSYTAPHANNEAPEMNSIGVEVPDEGQYADRDWPAAERAKAAVITRTDEAIGRIVDKIDELGLGENTLVIFTSDNGPHAEGGVDPEFFDSNGPLRGYKRDLYEGGIRVPMIARWPGHIAEGSTSDHVSAFWDYLPTAAELAGQPIPEGIDGVSFLPSLTNHRTQREHDFLYWEFHEASSKQAVRKGDWKAVRVKPSAAVELYDLSQDIGEQHNIADDHPDIVETMTELFSTARDDGETWPLTNEAETMPF